MNRESTNGKNGKLIHLNIIRQRKGSIRLSGFGQINIRYIHLTSKKGSVRSKRSVTLTGILVSQEPTKKIILQFPFFFFFPVQNEHTFPPQEAIL